MATEIITPPDVQITPMYLSEDDINCCCVDGNIDLKLVKMKEKHFGKTVKCAMIEQKLSRKFEAIFANVCDKNID